VDLPQWNPEWNRPDPLKGRPGWEPRHSMALAVWAALLIGVTGLAVPAVVKCRLAEANVYRTWEQYWGTQRTDHTGSVQPR
jgi:hypothetical protein